MIRLAWFVRNVRHVWEAEVCRDVIQAKGFEGGEGASMMRSSPSESEVLLLRHNLRIGKSLCALDRNGTG